MSDQQQRPHFQQRLTRFACKVFPDTLHIPHYTPLVDDEFVKAGVALNPHCWQPQWEPIKTDADLAQALQRIQADIRHMEALHYRSLPRLSTGLNLPAQIDHLEDVRRNSECMQLVPFLVALGTLPLDYGSPLDPQGIRTVLAPLSRAFRILEHHYEELPQAFFHTSPPLEHLKEVLVALTDVYASLSTSAGKETEWKFQEMHRLAQELVKADSTEIPLHPLFLASLFHHVSRILDSDPVSRWEAPRKKHLLDYIPRPLRRFLRKHRRKSQPAAKPDEALPG